MKKIVVALSILAVSFSTLMALSNEQKSAISQKRNRVEKVENSVAAASFKTMTFTPSSAYDYGYHGYSLYRMDGDRISWEPANGLIATTYDPKDEAAGPKSTAAMTGVWGDEYTPKILNKYSESSVWYRFPDISGCDKYKVATLPSKDVNTANQFLYISVYDNDMQEWSAKIPVTTGTSTPSKAVACHSDLTKDATGKYHLLMSVIYESASYTDRKLTVISGTATDPFNGPWTFTNYADNSFVVNATTAPQLGEASSNFRAAWGKNGFGIAAIECELKDTDGQSTFGYTYTKDYGQTWIKDAGNMFTVPTNSLFPWVGTLNSTGTDTLARATMAGNIAINVDENNDVHIMDYVWAGSSGTGYFPDLARNIDGLLVAGFHHFGMKFDQAGNPEAGATWKATMIAQGVGMEDGDNAEGATVFTEHAYSNNKAMNISCGANNTLLASWTDRPVANPLSQEELGTIVGVAGQDNWHHWVHNPYISYSFDGGMTWATSSDSVQRGFEIKTYADNKVQELGFGIAKNCKVTGDGAIRTIETYAAYAIPNLTSPCPASLGFTPGTEHSFWEQSWYVMQLKLENVAGPGAISTSTSALGKHFNLSQNYPNPFNPTTEIAFSLNNESKVNLSVFNAKGETVANLINAKMNKGAHTANFNASNLNSGVYFYKLTVDGQSMVKKMVLTK